MLILKLVVIPLFVALIALCGRWWGAAVVGLLSGLPVIAGPLSWFFYVENGLYFAQHAAVATVSGIVPLSSFCFTYSWMCSRFGWLCSLLISLFVFFALAFLIGNAQLELDHAATLAMVFVLLHLYFSPVLVDSPYLSPVSNAEIACRMVFALALVLAITHFAERLGESYSGVFSAFPIAGSIMAVFSHRNYSANHVRRSLKSMKQGLLSMLVFFYVIASFSVEFGFSYVLSLATLAALLLQATLIYLKKIIECLSLR